MNATAVNDTYVNNSLLLFGAWDRTGNVYRKPTLAETLESHVTTSILPRVTAIPSCKVVVSTYSMPGKLVSQISAV